MKLRRAAFALGLSTAIVVAIAALLPRAYLVNDDPGFALYLRLGAFTPWMSSVLNWTLVALYRLSPDVPWYGLYLYALIALTGTVLIHTCLELVDHRPGYGRVATWIGVVMLAASHVILAVGVTWTTVSISAMGTALVAFVAHVQTCRAAGTRASPLRSLLYGLLFVAGFALREAGIAVMLGALLPLIVWYGVGFVWTRYLPRRAALIAFVAPFVIVLAANGRIHDRHDQYEEFNAFRGKVSGVAAFGNLDKRAPELLTRVGWSLEDYRDFSNWLLADDTQFTTDKMRRLAETGGVPITASVGESIDVFRTVATEAGASVWLFLTAIAGGLGLVWLGVIDRRRGLWFSLGNLAFLMLVPVAFSIVSRFPQRLSLSFYTVAAFGMFVWLAGEIANRPTRQESRQRGDIALLVIAIFAAVWAKNLIAWTKREPWPYHTTLREFADRVTARHGMVMVAAGIAEMDPLYADPRGYDGLPGGWGTFTGPWFDYIHQFGIQTGAEFLAKMIDNPNAYVVATPNAHDMFESWFRRRVHNPSIRMSLVDAAAEVPTPLRSELYRLVTTPLERGGDEWKLLARNVVLAGDELPGPPDVGDLHFHSVAFSPPYDQLLAPSRHPAAGFVVEPVDGGIRYAAEGVAGDGCSELREGIRHAGIHVPLRGLRAVRLEITMIGSENIVGLYVFAQTETDEEIRWRWELDPAAQKFGFSGPFTLVPGYSSHQLELVGDTANADDVRDLQVFIAVKPGTRAGFELRRLEVSEP